MHRSDKERVVAELTERLRTTDTLIVADYRGLTMPQIDGLRSALLEHGARFTVVKNTLTRRAAEAAEAESLLALLDGPTAIAFLEAEGDPVAVAKALGDAARETRVLEVRGGILQGRQITAAEVESLAKLPAADVLRAQLVGALAGPMTTVVGLFNAPLRDLVGVVDARIRQLEERGEDPSAAAPAAEEDAAPEVAESEETSSAPAPPTEEEAAAGPDPEAAADSQAEEASGSEPQAGEETAGEAPAAQGEAEAQTESGEASGSEPQAAEETAEQDSGPDDRKDGSADAEQTNAETTTEES